MRILSWATSVGLLALCCGGPVRAQSPTEGPLAAPSVPAAPTAQPAKPKHRKPVKTAHHANPKADAPDYANAPLPTNAHPIARSTSAASPADPVDFGMKWNGSGDTARETRVQNYNGDAEGTGAQVGMKLHF